MLQNWAEDSSQNITALLAVGSDLLILEKFDIVQCVVMPSGNKHVQL